MSKIVCVSLLFLFVQGCSLFGDNSYNPELDVLIPTLSEWGDFPVVAVGAQLRIQANASVDRDGLDRVVITLHRRDNNRDALAALVYEFSDGPDAVFIDALLDIPQDLAPSQNDRDYSLSIRMEHGGGSLGHGIPVIIAEE